MNKIMAALMNVDLIEKGLASHTCPECGKRIHEKCEIPFQAHDSEGRMTYEVIDWAMTFPIYTTFQMYCGEHIANRDRNPSNVLLDMLSLSNFLTYLKDHLDDWAKVECPNVEIGRIFAPEDDHSQCVNCNGTGKIINPKYERAVELLKKWEGKGGKNV